MSSRKAETEEPDPMMKGDVAIIGMACLFPGAPGLDTYWQNIVSKVDAITDPPPEAWDTDVFYDPSSNANDRVYCKRGGFLGPLAYFDPLEHGIMPLAVQGGEPDQWLALQVARAALADAGYEREVPERHRTAVILGKGTYINRGNAIVVQHGKIVDQTLEILKTLHPECSEADLQTIKQELKRGLPPFSADTVPGLIPNIIAGRIANRLDLMGPSYTVDAACASSLIAVDIAMRDLLARRCDLALVGGAHVATPVPVLMLFCQLGAISRREQIRPFDKNADGTMLGEGIGMIVLKRREDAERDGNRIYAIIKGVGTASDGRGLSVTAPRLEGQVMALQRAYEMAHISPRTVGLIEAHGTATPVGDATEIEALNRIFGVRDGGLPWCALGSVKSMIGHLMPAAGVASLIKAALALYHRVLPPTLNVDAPNPELESEKTPFYVNTETRPWIHNAHNTPRRAGVSAFGFGGINAHVILEEYPIVDGTTFRSHQLRWDTEVCILSAESRPGLIQRAQQIQQFLSAGPQVDLKDLAYTLNVPSDQVPYRVAVVASNVEDLQQKLDRALERLSDPGCSKIKDVQGIYFFEQPLAASGQLAYLFPGEGSQYVNMLVDLCLHFPEVREHFDLIDRVFAEHTRDYVPSDYIFPRPAFSETERRAAEERLWLMEGAVEAVLTANQALFTLLSHLGLCPDAVAGHSTGEYSAMLASGMIDLVDETHVGRFAMELNTIYQQVATESGIPRATLVAVGSDVETVSAIAEQIDDAIYVAMDNCPHQTVIAGKESAVEQAIEHMARRGMIHERLPFDRPYHTPLFEAFATRLQAFFAHWLVSPPRIKTYSCTMASPFPTDSAQIQKVAVEHWMRPVEFRKTVEAMYADGVRIFVEVGPRGNLSAFVDDILRGRPHLAVPADVANRPGTTQLNHLVGMLAAQGVPIQMDYLYAHRSPCKLDLGHLDGPRDEGQKSSRRMKLATGWPAARISEGATAHLRERFRELTPGGRPLAADKDTVVGHEPVTSGDQPAMSAGATQVMSAHLQTMEQFLAVQQEVMQAFLAEAPPIGDADAQGTRNVPAQEHPNTPASQHPRTMPPPVQASPPSEGDDAKWPVSASLSPEEIATTLLQLVSERTGYPVEMLDLNLDLEADLGIDSIKRVEILGSFQQQTGLPREENMEALAGCRTLQEVIDLLATHNGDSRKLEPAPSTGTAEETLAAASQAVPPMPFIGPIVSLTPGEELVARCEINLVEGLFLRDHTLGRQVSVTDPKLRGLPIMPLTMSMEILAEGAAVLIPGQRLVEMRNVRAYRWLAFEGDRVELVLRARRHPSVSGHKVHVQMHGADDADGSQHPAATPIVEGTMIFGEMYPEPPAAGEVALRKERPSRWAPESLYTEGMFHGPAFRGVVSMDRWGEDGAEATLEVLPLKGLLAADRDRTFLIDPVLLDQPGQVVAFWMAEHVERGYVIFPFHLEALHLFGPPLPPRERVKCQARTTLVGDWQVRSDLDIVRADGKVWARFLGWEDRRFDLPRSFFRFQLSPRDVILSEPWSIPVASLPEPKEFQACRLNLDTFPEDLFTAHGRIWQRVLAHLVLSRRERELWSSLMTPEPRRIEWLLGRVAAKDAVRQYLRQRYDVVLCPADVEILPDSNGRPVVQGAWSNEVPCVPILSLSHSGGVAVAVVGNSDAATGVGVDIEHVGRMREGTEKLAFTSEERALLSAVPDAARDSWPLQLWCAKEAVAKALGQGLVGGPQALVIEELDSDTRTVHVGLAGEMAHRFPAISEGPIVAYTAREHDLIVATALYAHGPGKGNPT